MFHAHKHAEDIDVHNLAIVRGGLLVSVERWNPFDACIVERNVQATKTVEGKLDHPPAVFFRRDIGANVSHLSAGCANHFQSLRTGRLAPTGYDNFRSPPRKLNRGGPPNSCRPASDESHLVRKIRHGTRSCYPSWNISG